MSPQPTPQARSGRDDAPAADEALVKDVAAWVGHFARTLKTCRLYDPGNPAVLRFREELASGLKGLVERHGVLSLEVGSRELLMQGVPVYVAHSRDDNLAATLHRDGIRRISFLPAIEAREIEFLVDQMLHVTSPACGDDDLVTLLWEAELPGIGIVAAPLEGDADGGGEDEAEDAAPLPWPAPAGRPAEMGQGPEGGSEAGDETRSDDWDLLERYGDLEQAFDDLETSALQEIARIQQEHQRETDLPVVVRTVETLTEAMSTETTPADREDLAHFIPRVLREAIVSGDWASARAALAMLRTCDPQWSTESFFEGLGGGSDALTRKAIAALDAQGTDGVEAFLALATEFGPAASEWLMHVLADSQQQRTRRPLARALAAIVQVNPERLLPWMTDERWYVVRNVVHIMRWVGGDAVAAYVEPAIGHPDIRVRREVVAVLGQVSPEVARPILIRMLAAAEPPLFTNIVRQLSLAPDPAVVEQLVGLLKDERFQERSEDEKRAVYLALAAQGEPVLPALEDELARGGMFTRGLDQHWQSVARCIARIGTPEARAALERGLRSNKSGVRKACEMARASLGPDHE